MARAHQPLVLRPARLPLPAPRRHPDPGAPGTLLDNTLVLWTNELGQGNSHTLDNIPFVLVGGGLDFHMGRSLRYRQVPHNRLLLSLAHGFGHRITRFGNPDFCAQGVLPLA